MSVKDGGRREDVHGAIVATYGEWLSRREAKKHQDR